MIIVYLDEFGHCGPYFSKTHSKHNTSPIFGLGGMLLPEDAVRPFSTFFLKQKEYLLAEDIKNSGKQAYEWEKKGTNLFTAKSIEKYPDIKSTAFRMLSKVADLDGKVFFYGCEKIKNREDLNSNGLYKTILSECLRRIDTYCNEIDERFFVVMDQHSAHKELLETAAKTMFGSEPTRNMVSPPFECKSHLNQNIQAADWIATLVGRVGNYAFDQNGFQNYEKYFIFFKDRLEKNSMNSRIMPRLEKKSLEKQYKSVGSFGQILQDALDKKSQSSKISSRK